MLCHMLVLTLFQSVSSEGDYRNRESYIPILSTGGKCHKSAIRALLSCRRHTVLVERPIPHGAGPLICQATEDEQLCVCSLSSGKVFFLGGEGGEGGWNAWRGKLGRGWMGQRADQVQDGEAKMVTENASKCIPSLELWNPPVSPWFSFLAGTDLSRPIKTRRVLHGVKFPYPEEYSDSSSHRTGYSNAMVISTPLTMQSP